MVISYIYISMQKCQWRQVLKVWCYLTQSKDHPCPLLLLHYFYSTVSRRCLLMLWFLATSLYNSGTGGVVHTDKIPWVSKHYCTVGKRVSKCGRLYTIIGKLKFENCQLWEPLFPTMAPYYISRQVSQK